MGGGKPLGSPMTEGGAPKFYNFLSLKTLPPQFFSSRLLHIFCYTIGLTIDYSLYVGWHLAAPQQSQVAVRRLDRGSGQNPPFVQGHVAEGRAATIALMGREAWAIGQEAWGMVQ